MAEYVLTIRGVEQKVRLGSLNLDQVANRINRLSCEVYSEGGAFRVGLDDAVELTEDSVVRFAGVVDSLDESALTGWGADITTKISATDFSVIPTWRHVTRTFAAGTLKSVLTTLVADYLAVYGVTLDPTQPDGDTLPELTYTRLKVVDVLDDLSKRSGFSWSIDESKVLRMETPSAQDAPFDIQPSPVMVKGDITVSERREDSYANHAIVVINGAGPADVTETFVADGSSTATYVTKFPASRDIEQPWPNRLIVNGVPIDAPVAWGSGMAWSWDYVNHSLIHDGSGFVPNNGDVLTVRYGIGYPFEVIYQDDVDVAAKGPRETIVTVNDQMSIEAALELGQATVERLMARARKVSYTTEQPGLRVGQEQQIDEPYRGISSTSFLLNRITTRDLTTETVDHRVEATEGSFQSTYRDVIKTWFEGGGGSGGGRVSAPERSTAGAAAEPLRSVQFNRSGVLGGTSQALIDEDGSGQQYGYDNRRALLALIPDSESKYAVVVAHPGRLSEGVGVRITDDGEAVIESFEVQTTIGVIGALKLDVAEQLLVNFTGGSINIDGAEVVSTVNLGNRRLDVTIGNRLDLSIGDRGVVNIADRLELNVSDRADVSVADVVDIKALRVTANPVVTGTGAVPGGLLGAGRNASGSGAAGVIHFTERDGTLRYLWVDGGVLRMHTSRPTENDSVSHTAGTPIGLGPHASTHEDGGSDELDVTLLAGFPADDTVFLRGDGTFATPPGGSPAYYMSPLTTGGDPSTAELIFAPDGDVVMVPVYF